MAERVRDAVLPPDDALTSRVVIEDVTPAVDGGRFPVKRIVGDRVDAGARIAADGHDVLAADVLFHGPGMMEWTRVPMQPLGNDRWAASFVVDVVGRYEFTVEAWVDEYASWLSAFERRAAAKQPLDIEAQAGASLLRSAAVEASDADAHSLTAAAARLIVLPDGDRVAAARAQLDVMRRCQERRWVARHDQRLAVEVDRERAGHGAWYELFPRSCGAPGKHGTFADVEARLPYVAAMGFDVLYLPPIHPIGRVNRKGPDDTLGAGPTDPGSPWAIGSADGGHTAIHPALGTSADFRRLVESAAAHGLEVAMDVAFQCAPDHPWVTEHPGWFKHLPDGSIRFAENPPKKYEDIVALDFECDDWRGLWGALLGVVLHWAGEGVRIFRVDNPHTKPFPFWEWLIRATKDRYPDAIFLAEAFTRPAVMHRLARLGFSQSYTYFAWRNTKDEIEAYFRELGSLPGRDYLRPSLWPNTPDILTEYLQEGGRGAFIARFVLAATLGANYGIYGPAFELCESRPRWPGSEEYRKSEKYELRSWDIDDPESLSGLIGRVNQARREHPALRQDQTLTFHPASNEMVLCYSKHTDTDAVVVVVNLDPHDRQGAELTIDWEALGVDAEAGVIVHDVLSGRRQTWGSGPHAIVLDPGVMPAALYTVSARRRTERDFEYFL